jgi:xylose isomerase
LEYGYETRVGTPGEISADGRLAELVKSRYASWNNSIGASIEAGKEDFVSLEKYVLSRPNPIQSASGHQELCENIVNELICAAE